MTRRDAGPTRRGPGLFTTAVALCLATEVVWVVALVTAGEQARHATGGDVTVPRHLLGLPLLESFHRDGRLGAHVMWGSVVLAVAPLVAVLVLAAVRGRRGRLTRAGG